MNKLAQLLVAIQDHPVDYLEGLEKAADLRSTLHNMAAGGVGGGVAVPILKKVFEEKNVFNPIDILKGIGAGTALGSVPESIGGRLGKGVGLVTGGLAAPMAYGIESPGSGAVANVLLGAGIGGTAGGWAGHGIQSGGKALAAKIRELLQKGS